MPTITDAQLAGVLNQLKTARIYTPANDRGLIDNAIKTLTSLSAAVPSPVVVPPAPLPPVVVVTAPVPQPPALTQADVARFRGVNYGSSLEDFTVGVSKAADGSPVFLRPTDDELRMFSLWGATYLRVALMRGFNENGIAERALAQRISKIWAKPFSMHRHTYAKDGRPVNGEPQGRLLTKDEVVAQAVHEVGLFGDIPGWFFLGMNEPSINYGAAAWIETCVAEYDAVRAKFSGLIVSSIPGNSLGAASSLMGGIPQRMLDDPFWTYGGSMYPVALGDYGYRASVAELDANAKSRWDHPATFADGLKSWVNEGPQGQLVNGGPLAKKVPLATEVAFSQPQHTVAFAKLFKGGWALWATGANPDWRLDGPYRQAIQTGDLAAFKV